VLPRERRGFPSESWPFQSVCGPFQSVCGPFQSVCGPFQSVCGPFQSESWPFQNVCGLSPERDASRASSYGFSPASFALTSASLALATLTRVGIPPLISSSASRLIPESNAAAKVTLCSSYNTLTRASCCPSRSVSVLSYSSARRLVVHAS
jgi:hypothetical protein